MEIEMIDGNMCKPGVNVKVTQDFGGEDYEYHRGDIFNVIDIYEDEDNDEYIFVEFKRPDNSTFTGNFSYNTIEEYFSSAIVNWKVILGQTNTGREKK